MSSDLHSAWARLLVSSLVEAGVVDFVVSPGSRSTPLALAIASSAARAEVVIDERAAAFFALGQARVTGRPSALVCTSGTAAAHYLPAIIEASQSHLPLVVVTADRPWELAGCGASQTIDQAKLFGTFTRWFADIGEPDASPSAVRGVCRVAAQAVARALGPTPGPVHLNARFRKPLEPRPQPTPEAWSPLLDAVAARGPTRGHAASRAPAPDGVRAIASRLLRAERGIVVAGPSPVLPAAARHALFSLAARLGLAVFAEATSQLRFGPCDASVVRVGALDLVLGAARGALLEPDLILQLGATPTSSAFGALAESGAARIVVSPHTWSDPWGSAVDLVDADAGAFATAMLAALGDPADAVDGARRSRWLERVAGIDAVARRAVELDVDVDADALGEGEVARALVAACPEGAILAVGNSTPVRDLDLWCVPGGAALEVVHQRGAAGIDGLIAGAAGSRQVADRPTALLLGDVSFSHDVGGLALAPRAGAPLVIVVVDNGGGRIFEALPVFEATAPATFERFFATPPALDIEAAARAFGVRFVRASSPDDLARALATAFATEGTTVVRAVVPKGAAAPRAKRLRAAFEGALKSEFEPKPKGALS